MSQDTAAWTKDREKAALGRVRLTGMGLGLVLVCVAAWLGWRERTLGGLGAQTSAAVAREAGAETFLRLKFFTHAAYAAKIRENALLSDLLGLHDLEGPCMSEPDLRKLPGGAPCAVVWKDSLARIWAAAYGAEGPPLPAGLSADRWGSPFLLNLSEASCGRFGAWCPPDVIRSAGPDAKANTPDDIQAAIPQYLGPSRIK